MALVETARMARQSQPTEHHQKASDMHIIRNLRTAVLCLTVGIALAAPSIASASEPMKLTETQMDIVTAGYGRGGDTFASGGGFQASGGGMFTINSWTELFTTLQESSGPTAGGGWKSSRVAVASAVSTFSMTASEGGQASAFGLSANAIQF